jgi:hypothetical protein
MTCWIAAAFASAQAEVKRDYYEFYHGFAKNSVGIQFHMGDYGSTDQGSSLYTYQDYLLWTATSRVVYVKDSVSAWRVKEDCV